jgi:hypothetical protein
LDNILYQWIYQTRILPRLGVNPLSNNVTLGLWIFFAVVGLAASEGGLVCAQEQQLQQQVLSNNTTNNFTLNIDVLGVNSGTRNSTISITGPEGQSLSSNKSVDLFSRAQEEYANQSNPVALTIPLIINSSLIHEGEEVKVCLTLVDTGKVDCEVTVITIYNKKGFPKSVPLEAGGSIEEQINELPK